MGVYKIIYKPNGAVGEDVVQEELDEIVSFLEREYDVEVEAHEGLQPVYSFIIGVE